MEKKVNPGSYHDQYFKLLEVPVGYLKAVQWKVPVELEEINFVKGLKNFRVSESDEIDKGKLKAVETLKARQDYFFNKELKEDVFFINYLWCATMKTAREAVEKYEDYILSPMLSRVTLQLSDGDKIDISALVDFADTDLKNIKAYNSKILAVLEAEDLNEVILQEMSNHCLRLCRVMWSLDMKMIILRFHLIQRRPDLMALVDEFGELVEGELQQYEEERKTTWIKVFELVKKKTNMFGLRWLPDSWKGALVIAGVKIVIVLCEKVNQYCPKISYNYLRHLREKNLTLLAS